MAAEIESLQRLEGNGIAEIHLAQLSGGKEKYYLRRVRRPIAEKPEVQNALRSASAKAAGMRAAHLLEHAFFDARGASVLWADRWQDGVCLTSLLQRMAARENRLSPPAALLLFEDVCTALGELHAAGINFGLLCPEHILLGRDGKARLMAAGFESALLGIKSLAQQQLRGRRQYLPPEIMRGRHPTPSSDVYAAASLAYHFVTGRLATEDGEGAAVSTRHQAITPPSHVCRSLPFACDAVFMKALSSNPAARPHDGNELAEAFRKLRASLTEGKDTSREELIQLVAAVASFEKYLGPATPKPLEVEQPEPLSLEEEEEPPALPSPPPAAQTAPEPTAQESTIATEFHREETPTDQFLAVRSQEVDRDEEKIPAHISCVHDTQEMPQAQEMHPAPAAEAASRSAEPTAPKGASTQKTSQRKGRTIAWLLAAVLAMVALALWQLWPQEPPEEEPAAKTEIGFLSVSSDLAAQVTLDGEVLGSTPLKHQLLRAGSHRVIVRSAGGQLLLDKEIVLHAGEHQLLQVVGPPAEQIQTEAVPSKKPVSKTNSKNKKKIRRSRR